MTSRPLDMREAREQQIADTLRTTAELRAQGWGKVLIEVTRGGTFRVEVEAGDGAKVDVYQSIGRRK